MQDTMFKHILMHSIVLGMLGLECIDLALLWGMIVPSSMISSQTFKYCGHRKGCDD
jgi:hypothetical protein